MQAFLSPQQANVTQWLNYLPQRAEILTQRSNLMPQQAKNTVNDLPVVPKSLSDIKQVGFTPSSLFSRDQQAAVGSFLRIEVFLLNTSLLLNALRKK